MSEHSVAEDNNEEKEKEKLREKEEEEEEEKEKEERGRNQGNREGVSCYCTVITYESYHVNKSKIPTVDHGK